MKIALLGGAGFIGTHLTQAYLEANHDVVVIDNLSHSTQHTIDPRARFYHIDIRSPKLHTILSNERPDIVSYHVAYTTDELPQDHLLLDADTSIRGLLNVLESCADAAIKKFIFASGGNTLYGTVDPSQLPLKEETPLQPKQPVDISRMTGEWYVRYYARQYGFQHTILRYANVYGEQATNHPLSYCMAMLLEQRAPIIRGSGDSMHDHIYIDDVVRANLLALVRGDNQTFHISSGEGYTIKHLYRLMAQALGSTIEPVTLSGSLAETEQIVLDNSLARSMLGWYPEVSLYEGIQRMLQRLDGHPHTTQSQQKPTLTHIPSLV
ncbi:UDP-glucose 4-epimerase [Thermosporothrix hazakensis]|jgi:UDP-glucose 4-epimerase|uniref:UDP-glucose 4-epimerase n=2 Tax=Thermosporothrix TaxID=768650 RepID=A0A326UCA4_THEHA|nr:NAD-dependent epimerase/dehydratase family protein [Thermosporothrix hazakensis]PZW36252.1 UDP-glucose 4-epimerase [Thermosporothrix hazakensis]BBH88716.1 UDP-glucose 4-epimerase [Thermosporothrix sp. COM3]GCE46901.1 UDP-glucose 4-epimerase [Thermosporothrix hazakensis]